MTVPFVLALIALVLAVVVEFNTRGRSLLGWAVVLVCAALLWGNLT